MPTEIPKNLQRALADAIVTMAPMDEIRILLACGAKVNEVVTQGLRSLHYAVWQKNIPAINLLLIRGADINAVDDCGYSALHLACEHGYYEIAKTLIKGGAQVDYREDSTEEMYPRTTVCDEPLRLALRNKHYDVARLLLENGACPNRRYFFGSEINLATDAESFELLLNYGANVDSLDRSGLTPLMRLVRIGTDMESILILLGAGANVNAMTDARNDYRTVLHYGVLSGNPKVVTLLLKQGAKPDAVNPFGEPDTPSPLHLAILKGDPFLVSLLLEAGADPNRSTNIIGSPLHVACTDAISKRIEIMKILLASGADPNIRIEGQLGSNTILRPPLAELLASNDELAYGEVQLLLKYGAKVIMKTQYRDPDGILNHLSKVNVESNLFLLLLSAAEAFNPSIISRATCLTEELRSKLLEACKTPQTLKTQARTCLKNLFARLLPQCAPMFDIPVVLKRYLLYDYID